MRLTIESTEEFFLVDGCPTRRWCGHTEDGRRVEVFVRDVVSLDGVLPLAPIPPPSFRRIDAATMALIAGPACA